MSALAVQSDQVFTGERLNGLLTSGATIRHDVDFDLGCAMEMAKLEHTLGVHSCFLLRTDGVEYSDGAAAQAAGVLEMYGHIVGIHPDLGLPRDAGVTASRLAEAADTSFRIASEHWTPDKVVAFHAPPVSVLWRDVPGFSHMMANRWRGRYLSDSRGRFLTSPEDSLPTKKAAKNGVRFQLNLHPEWWFLAPDEAERLREQEAGKP